MAYIRILIVLVGIGVFGIKLDTFQCSNEQYERCLISVTLEGRSIDDTMSTVDSMRHCRNIREGMNCLVWYSVNCISQSQRPVTKNIIENVRQYLKNVCEDFEQVDENWLESSCFLKKEMSDCKDNYFKHNGYKNIDEFSCGHYYQFKRCVEQTLEERCAENHAIYLTTYLLDNADHFARTCSQNEIYFDSRSEQLMLRSVKGAQCLMNYREKLHECRRSYNEVEIQLIENDDMFASACCAFNKYSSCIKDVVGINCKGESIELVNTALSRLNRDHNIRCSTYRGDVCSSCTTLSFLIVLISGMLLITAGWNNI